MRTRRALPFVVVLAVFGLAAHAADAGKEAPKASPADAQFEHFKQLAGEWVGKGPAEAGKDGHEMHVIYKVTSGGSAVVETIMPGTEHEMVTVIHKDGDALVLTHYCMLGNQPHMKAEEKGDANKVVFKFTGASNLKSEKDMHMHGVTFTFVDKDTLKSEWSHYVDGKEGGTVAFELKRKK
jgi:hypothetical protein